MAEPKSEIVKAMIEFYVFLIGGFSIWGISYTFGWKFLGHPRGVAMVLISVCAIVWSVKRWFSSNTPAGGRMERRGTCGQYLEGLLKRTPDSTYSKPCHELGFCPYGSLIEEFPLTEGRDGAISCTVFGHDCPVFYCGSPFAEAFLTS